jgi:hypothetical protein
MKNNIRYIVVHSSQTLPDELYISLPYHYIIHRNGKLVKQKELRAPDSCVQIAYLGGIDKQRNVCDTKTAKQSEVLFNTLVLLTEKHPEARIVGANEIFGNSNDPGFDVKQWLSNYMPQLHA